MHETQRHPAVVALTWLFAGPVIVVGGILYALAIALMVALAIGGLVGLIIGIFG